MSMIRLDYLKLCGVIAAVCLAVLFPVNLQAEGISADFRAGSVIIGQDLDTCTADKAGAMRFNSASGIHQFCNGLGWAGFTANPPSVLLGIIPSSNLLMNVNGPGNPAYGAIETFTVKNFGTTTSSNLTVDLTQSGTNFDIMSDDCTGVALAEGQSCDITIRPKANDSMIYSGTLTIPQNNVPMASLKGVASGFGCAPGVAGGGGVYAACGSSYNLVATPGGCTNSTTPTCAGGPDTTTKAWGSQGLLRDGVSNYLDGPQNSVNLMAYVAQEGAGAHPAAEYCRDMTYGGFSDWYLPSDSEVMVLYGARNVIGGWVAASYWSSRQSDASNTFNIDSAGAWPANTKSNAYRVRCVRRETQALPDPQYDLRPDNTFFVPVMTTTGNRVSSNIETITGVSTDIAVSIANDTSGGARIKINGGAEVTSGTVGYGDTIELVMTAPGSTGLAHTVDINLGDDVSRWKVGVPNETGTRRIFVSEAGSGNIGGVGAADARCQAEVDAIGLGGTWIALVSEVNSATNQPALRMDFNWDTLTNMNGQTVATDWNDLWDGSIGNTINYDEVGALVSTNTAVYTGTATTGVPGATSRDCSNWLTSSTLFTGSTGLLTATNSAWIANTTPNCSTTARLYCFEQVPSPGDTTPDAFNYNPMTKQAAASTADVAAASIVIGGINTATPVSVSGGGSPEYQINGGGWTSTPGTINNGDTLDIRADAPATNGQRHKVTVTVGTYTTYWYVGAGDTGLTRRVFLRSATANGNLGGAGGADLLCRNTASAIGMGTNWGAIISESGVDSFAVNRTNVNWGTLVNLAGSTIATSWDDLWDGTISTGINRTEAGTTITGGGVITGTLSNGRAASALCSVWTTSTTSLPMQLGSSGSTSSTWLTNSTPNCGTASYLYCIETGANPADRMPNVFTYIPMTRQAAPSTADVATGAVGISGIDSGTAVSVSGGGNPEYQINGGAWTSTPGTINSGDTLNVRADTPATANQRNKVTIKVGDYTTYWYLGAGNTGNTKRIFVTGASVQGNIGGTGGADAWCSQRANSAGLGTAWKALISDSEVDQYAVNRVPLDWGTLQNMNGQTVATSWNDLWDGTIGSAINRSEFNMLTSGNVWTGSDANGVVFGNTCLGWTTSSTSSTLSTRYGTSSLTSSSWLSAGVLACNNSLYFYCIEQ
ncbi:MAG: hypothetical protein NDJ24_03250 [Alphaproteobacteria bacterium]|nr:hypothetical protein [Alphaproteobacteria bacterium]